MLLRGGIDLSIGGMISLGTVIAATRFADDPATVRPLVAGHPGAGRGDRRAQRAADLGAQRCSPSSVTLATWSILNGTAMIILPTDGGSVPGWWLWLRLPDAASACPARSGCCLPLLVFWWWFRATRARHRHPGDRLQREVGVPVGVSITRINVLDLRALRPVRGRRGASTSPPRPAPARRPSATDYILPSVAAAVIGGVSLFGGRGHLAGTAGRRLHPHAHRQPRVRAERSPATWQPGRLRRHPAASRCSGKLDRRKGGAREVGMSSFSPATGSILLGLCRHGAAAGRHRAVLAGFPVGLQHALDQWCSRPSSASSRSARLSSSIGGGIDLSVPWVLNSAAIIMALLCAGQDLPLLWVAPVGAGRRRYDRPDQRRRRRPVRRARRSS